MCKIKIENIGPLKKVNIELEKITVVIGPQSSGKSTLAKLICFCQWVEKRCYINFEDESKRYMAETYFVDTLSAYHRMEDYVMNNSYMLYNGNFINIELIGQHVTITKSDLASQYLYPKICYIPAERNIVSAVPNIKKYNEKNDSMLYFGYDWTDAREYLKDMDFSSLLEKDIKYHFDKKDENDIIFDGDVPIKLMNASSGVQSIIPLYMVLISVLESVYIRLKPLSPEQRKQVEDATRMSKMVAEQLAVVMQDAKEKGKMPEEITINVKGELPNALLEPILKKEQEAMDLLDSYSRKFFYQNTHVYIEEPEQNIFPNTQAKFLYWLLSELKHPERDHTAFITTHSPFILFALNNCLMGGLVGSRIGEAQMNRLLSHDAWIDPKKVAVYELHDGELKSIQDEDRILLNNYLNKAHQQIASEYLSMLSYYEPRK